MKRFGIDLGTTNTVIYCAESTIKISDEDEENFSLQPVPVQYENTGDLLSPGGTDTYIMPSALYAVPTAMLTGDYEYYIGNVAVKMAIQHNDVCTINTKRLLCREENTDTVIAYGLTAQDIAQKFLEGCKFSIIKFLSGDTAEKKFSLSDHCVTRPAAFGLFANQSIHAAAKMAGFRKAAVQREPIAALLSLMYSELKEKESAERLFEKQKKHGGKLLTIVVDIGGGTTDVTIQEICVKGQRKKETTDYSGICTGYHIEFLNMVKDKDDDKNAPVAAANQVQAFGGYEFDREIVSHIIAEWLEKYQAMTGEKLALDTKEMKQSIEKLYIRVRDYKNSLSLDARERHDEVKINGKMIETVWSAEKFYEWTKELCISPPNKTENAQTIYGIITDTIRRSNYNIDDIDYFFVTGGMSFYKPIREMLKEKFSGLSEKDILIFSENPLYDIAIGAAVCDCYFSVKMPQSFLYCDLMIDDPCGDPKVIVEKNTALPITHTIDKFMKLRNPVYFQIDVLSGNGINDCKMKYLRKLKKPIAESGHKVAEIGTDIPVKYTIDVHQSMSLELIVHDPLEEYSVTLVDLIKDVDLIGGRN